MSRALVISIGLAVTAGQAVLAAELHVPGSYATIALAIDSASNGDEIIVAPGTYTDVAGGALVFPDGKALYIHSSDGPTDTILNGGGSNLGFVCNSGEQEDTILEGFTILSCSPGIWTQNASPTIRDVLVKNCSDSAFSGGFNVTGGAPYVDSCTFEGCAGNVGGAIYVTGGDLHLVSCWIEDCSAMWGGGVVAGNSASLTMDMCVVKSCTATFGFGGGGAVYADSGATADLWACWIDSNIATYGGGVYINGGSLVSEGNLYEGNLANYGGAVCTGNAWSSTLDVFWENTAGTGGVGGGIWMSGGGTIDGGELVANVAGSSGGGIYVAASSVTIKDTWFWSNTPNNITGSWSDGGGVETAGECGADVTGDETTDVSDITELVSRFGSRCVTCRFDIDDDGVVGVTDLLAMLQQWGGC